MSRVVYHNLNRMHAIKQFKKGLKAIDDLPPMEEVGDVRMLGAILNALVYVGDGLNELNETIKKDHLEISYALEEEE